ncbi:hypothetical protein SPRG_17322 [Saprolegnia parasitica CBS 223.65]|uniref:Uncharacterized protein n=1 Tax=Saprolegnia parasitica (strain CBS 223.65) TaxID=695850 RepID=A0A067BSJ6_SAPPC|nr:hypothetical protein SPRG_17322 [Saprolegnia parasitica CBS 223.65]KDO17246.1 hypothetical protein SPRG_17322 [Saprolegnia parasitica CBS 223.65]|eukprot:XP_012212046.1 hypothetical protein SPRG_17322 [Saprolegnia parasitica CBS 223.65]
MRRITAPTTGKGSRAALLQGPRDAALTSTKVLLRKADRGPESMAKSKPTMDATKDCSAMQAIDAERSTKPTLAIKSKAVDLWNAKINRCHDRAVIHTFRNALLALDVTLSVAIGGGQTTSCISSDNNNKATTTALTTATIPIQPQCTLRKLTTVSLTARSSKTSTCIETTYQVPSSSWRLVATTDDGTDLGIYQAMLPSYTLIALVWKAGLDVLRVHAIASLPALATSLLQRVVAPVFDDVDSQHGFRGYTIAVTMRQLDSTVLWEHEFYAVDFDRTQDGAMASLLSPAGAFRDKCRLLAEVPHLAVATEAFTSRAASCVLLDVAIWDFEKSLRAATSHCVLLRREPQVATLDLDVPSAQFPDSIHMALETPDVTCRINCAASKKRAVVLSVVVGLRRLFLQATYGVCT